jgi:AcrR family transcriptional regulator
MVSAILQAAAELFAEHGYARTTTNKVAVRAGVSVGSLYQYFPNKDSLLAGLMEQHHVDVHRVVGSALERLADPATPLEDGIRVLLAELVALHRETPALTKALSAAVLRESPAAEDAHKRDGEDRNRHVVAVLKARPDVRAGDHEAMAFVLGQATAQLGRWLVHDAPPGKSPDILAEEVTQLLTRYLRA